MPNYDFRSLSSYDFELLARDLLQAELRLRLESFCVGRDSGIDFRYVNRDTHLIVQCKHYVESGFSSLATVLRKKERSKIETLSPTRYILATSVPLTPSRKDDIVAILAPYCKGAADVYGPEDLNNLLGLHSDVERKNLKLWLTSEAVLRRVLDAGIFSDTDAHLDRVRRRMCRYVQNPSFDRAREILNKSHFCIIAGIPGIGKTTLAQVLLADLVDRRKYEAFRISQNLDELRRLKNKKRRQVFYFDDFLGTTTFDKLQKNEDQRLMELIEEVASNKRWRFILTTREYILNTAKLRYESFAHPRVDFKLCVIKLDDYTRPIRAKILYNHIYFSDLPKSHKLALLQDRSYEQILAHRNYNPRVIEFMTQSQHACSVAAPLYLSEFVDSLEHPTRIWDHAFRHQISEAARHLLLVLATLPRDVLLQDLEHAFWDFYRQRQALFGFATTSEDWSNALRELDGNFVSTQKFGDDVIVSFHNPSIRDYLEYFLLGSDSDVLGLIRSARFYEQYVSLWQERGGRRYPGLERNRDEFLGRLKVGIQAPSAFAVRTVGRLGEQIGFRRREVSAESRAEFAVRVATEMGGRAAEDFMKPLINTLSEQWRDGVADREDLARLAKSLEQQGWWAASEAFISARGCLLATLEEVADFRAIASFVEAYREELSDSELEHIRERFMGFAPGYSEGWEDDPDWLRQVAADIEFVGERLAVEVESWTGRLNGRADEIEEARASQEPDEGLGEQWRSPTVEREAVDEMFQGLLRELED